MDLFLLIIILYPIRRGWAIIKMNKKYSYIGTQKRLNSIYLCANFTSADTSNVVIPILIIIFIYLLMFPAENRKHLVCVVNKDH